MKGRDYYQAALVIKDVCKENNVLFIVNDRLDVALAAEADGVHLGQKIYPCMRQKKLATSWIYYRHLSSKTWNRQS